MRCRSFLKLVEIQTKLASVLPFIAGNLYAAARFRAWNWDNALIMLVSLLAIDMLTTASNNYIDFRTARKRHGYGYAEHNAIGRDALPLAEVRLAMAILFAIAASFGLWLSLRTGPEVLALGVLSLFIGLAYSLGPLPISRTPWGELASGLTMGFLIPLISVLIHLPRGALFDWSIDARAVTLSCVWPELLWITLLGLPLCCAIANIMLANNICDQADDKENGRLTLPLVIGTKAALRLFAALYAPGYLAIGALVLAGVAPWYFLLYGFSAIPVARNLRVFFGRHVKAETFSLAVQNFGLQSLSLIALLTAWALSGGIAIFGK